MKKPEIESHTSDADLAGESYSSSWVKGHNCVYHVVNSEWEYRVSIKTQAGGWESYGFFNDLGVATYVANVAILAENCEDKYQLNKVFNKDKRELNRWRQKKENIVKESIARRKYREVQAVLERIHAEEQRKAEEANKLHREEVQKFLEEKEKERKKSLELQQQKEREAAKQLKNVPTSELLDLLQRDLSGSEYRAIRSALLLRGYIKGVI